jgi:DNA-binding SARP family transcriptional activator/tetratricopeptide (TPR) repeat protein
VSEQGLDWVLVKFGVLGPLQVDGRYIALPAKQRIVLAVLLLHANRVVPVGALIDALWGDAPPASARTTLQGYVKQLRRNDDAGIGERLMTRSPGYLIRVTPGEFDLDRFTELRDQARTAEEGKDWLAAADLLKSALALWRGDPLADVPSAVLQRIHVPRLAELRMRTVESLAEADLRLGRHHEIVAELRQVTMDQPLREEPHGQLMLALYRCGRQAEALEVFRDVGRRLRKELGVSPGPRLQELHQRILTADPSLAGNPAAAGATTPVPAADPAPAEVPAAAPLPVAPAQLPPDTADFTGREEQVKLLCQLLATPPDQNRPGAVVVSALAGMAGIGKTALAVHVAHRLRDRFPDGQLYVNLQGATAPLQPAEVLSRLLRDLGDPDRVIPTGGEERAARYRSLLATRKMLIVLDDAREAAQVRPLLPGSADCAVLVTSRTVLTGLAGAARLSLDALADDEARDLFSAIVGPPRAIAEPEAVAAVLACCAGLPLAIRIAGSRLASRPAWSVAQLAARLASERSRLAELAVGDLAVRTSFAVSYDALPGNGSGDGDTRDGAGDAAPARVFRLLGLPGMAELSLPAIAALAGRPAEEVATALETLTDAHLLESPAPDRYRLHDLIRSYAAECAEQADSRRDRDAALDRMLSWYGAQTIAAAQTLVPYREFPAIAHDLGRTLGVLAIADREQAFAWFEAEVANLTVATRQASGTGRDDVSVKIAIGTVDFFLRTAHIKVWVSVCQQGVLSAGRLGDDAALSYLLRRLGQAYGEDRRFTDADQCFTEALEIQRRTGDTAEEARTLNSLAVSLSLQGQHEPALQHLRTALDIVGAPDDQQIIATVLNNIGHILCSLKRYEESLENLERALAIGHQFGDGFFVCMIESSIGRVYLDMGGYKEAVEHCQWALAAHHGTTRDRGEALYTLGCALAFLGQASEAREAWLTALPILDRLGDPLAAEVRRRLG